MSPDSEKYRKNELPEQDLNKFQEMTELWPPPGLKRVVFVREGLQKSRSHVCWKRSTNETQKSSKMITNEVRDSQNHAQSEYQNRLDFRDAKSSKKYKKMIPKMMPKSGFFRGFWGSWPKVATGSSPGSLQRLKVTENVTFGDGLWVEIGMLSLALCL